MKKITFTYGDRTLDLSFPQEFLAGELIKPKPSKLKLNKDEMAVKIDKALKEPNGTKRLRKMVNGKKVGLVISDEFRAGAQEMIAQQMMNEIFLGNPESLNIFIATGSHDAKIYGKNLIPAILKIANKTGKKINILPNDCDSGEHIDLGNTKLGTCAQVWKEWLKTEVRVYGHESKHHYMNGYSSIDKQLCPGLASRKTIAGTHKQALQHQKSSAGRIYYHNDPERKENPFSYDNRQVRLIADRHLMVDDKVKDVGVLPTFLLDMISTANSIDWIEAGDPDIVTQNMTKAADELAAHYLPKTQYVVISPGGPPACNALYGVQNCFDMALKFAIKNGGEALILAPCLGRDDLPKDVSGLAPDEKAKVLFWDNLVKWRKKPLEEWNSWVKNNFKLYLWKTDRVLKLLLEQKVKLYLYSELADEIVIPGGFIPVKNPNQWIAQRALNTDAKVRAIDDGNKLLIIPI